MKISLHSTLIKLRVPHQLQVKKHEGEKETESSCHVPHTNLETTVINLTFICYLYESYKP